MGASSGLVLAEGRSFPDPFPMGEEDCGLVNPPKEPKDPDNRFEKLFRLLWVVDDLLDTVDCDHRFRFPTPSRTPWLLSGRLCAALDRRRLSGDRLRMERLGGLKVISLGLCGFRVDGLGRGPCREEVALVTVTTEDDEAEVDLVD